ncbi:MAG: hypothetical protein P1U61_04440 [Legionellaceae bacterium]|nr:hypothetical protein [Legionellaceae bacterium]
MNIKRVMNLMKNDLLMLKDIATYLYIIFVCVSSGLSTLGMPPTLNQYLFFLCGSGFIFTSYAFSDLHEVSKGYSYLILPASKFEKLFARWLLTSIVYAFIFTFLLYGLFVLNYFTNDLMPNVDAKVLVTQLSFWHSLRVIFPGVLHVMLFYLALHALVFLGCIYFKKHALFKVSLSVMTLMSVLILFFAGMLYLLGPGLTVSSFMNLFKQLFVGGYYFFWILLAPICLSIAYVRFKEYEI